MYDQYLGRVFDEGSRNCLTLASDYYRTEIGLQVPDYAVPTGWYAQPGFDLFGRLLPRHDFQMLSENVYDWREGDFVLMAIGSPHGFANHCGVLVNGGRSLLHHATGRLSEISPLSGWFRRSILNVYRHASVLNQPLTQVTLT